SGLEHGGDGVRRIELSLFRTDGVVRRIAAGTSRPLRNPEEIRALFVERLTALADALHPGFGFDMARTRGVTARRARSRFRLRYGAPVGARRRALPARTDRYRRRGRYGRTLPVDRPAERTA